MGNVSMEASQINYRGGETKMSVEQALKETSGEAAAIAQLQTDVGNLQTTKANQITIAPFFSAETAYDPGDLVYYNGMIYRCVNAHEGEWDADDFAATTISTELDSLKSGLTIKSKTFNVNTGGVSQVSFEMDDTEQIPIHVTGGSNDIFSLAGKIGLRWKFAVGRLTREPSVNNTYFYEALFNQDITITVYYIC